ncbi:MULTISPECIES: potassium-transporting ATPase subunit KdpC [Chromobacterium]|uniref:Potassium-transporting ATPase KdpC subunit n=2 Tax=Chromobacterium TaxID=535 RepID=A0AAX2MA80_CHRVL|nr:MULTISPECIES: potassium-transporting ATPase subunit KdpC [Chromobacterium]AXE32442.1 potassium-transporting ATPase subunit KdpC [Chromobacterium phragmitis]AXE33786.1 potassium-transporting ATPase subunit KdpC [Chromobacterium phragmitis]OLZ84441.1 potassium-transporting ATPase subunit C [Chromobacterium violaceum]STB71159.1 potassium-transporting ATPase subunit C [Chromobacterium violaceum]SUX33297.1 potassium-transporting ATPase subunit C [Chromobacterium violaceum]
MKLIRPLLVVFGGLSLITGLAYPLAATGIAQAAFPAQANGSLIEKDGKVVGSRLIGQSFAGEQYFWGRPSATGPMPYNAGSSGGANLGPTNPAQLAAVKGNVETIRKAHPTQTGPVPVDLVTASASGLDPEISAASAYYQVDRVAAARKLPADAVRKLVDSRIVGETFGLLGEPRVNVLELNLALDDISKKA